MRGVSTLWWFVLLGALVVLLAGGTVLTLLATIRAVRCPGVIGNRWYSRAG